MKGIQGASVTLFTVLLLLAGAGTASAAAPANDNFADAQLLTGNYASVAGTVAEATREDGEPVHPNTGQDRTVWYRWTASETGGAVVDLCGDPGEHVAGVYTGTEVADLTPLVEGGYCREYFPTTAGVTYAIQMNPRGRVTLDNDPFSFTLSAYATPANDDFADAELLTSNSNRLTGNNAGATGEPGEPDHSGNPERRSIWFRWVASTDGTVAVQTCNSRFTPVNGIYTGSAVDDLTPVSVDSCVMHFSVDSGTTYYLQVDTFDSDDAGELTGTFNFYPPPPNDDFADAQAVTGDNAVVPGYNYAAAQETPDETLPGPDATGKSVWYSWTAPADGSVFAQTCTNSYQSALAVYEGTDLSSLDPFPYEGCFAAFAVQAGHTYRIAVSGYGTYDEGAFKLRLKRYPVLENDDFADAIQIEGDTATVTGHNVGASREEDEARNGSSNTERSVWYRWTAPASGTVTFDTCGSNYDTTLAVWTGTGVDALDPVAENDDSPDYQCGRKSAVTFPVEAGTEYRIAVDGYAADSMGNLNLRLYPGEFVPLAHTIGVARTGDGTGTVLIARSNDGPGTECDGACDGPFKDGGYVQFDAYPAEGSAFTGWTGIDCEDPEATTCIVEVNEDTTATASFTSTVDPPPPPPDPDPDPDPGPDPDPTPDPDPDPGPDPDPTPQAKPIRLDFGQVKLNRKKGTAILRVTPSEPAKVTTTGFNLWKRLRTATSSKRTVRMPIIPVGRLKTKLNTKGHGTAWVKVRGYPSAGGVTVLKTIKVRLKLNRKYRRHGEKHKG